MAIDPTARVHDGARIGDGVEIGPYCVVGPSVTLGDGVRLIGHVNVSGVTMIGERTVVYPYASLGTPPQSVHYRGSATRLEIGPGCELRENVTINTGTEDGGGITRLGANCLIMVGSHIAHDCQIGNGVMFANLATLGGHVSIGDNAFLGGLVAVHQHGHIGEGVMIGGLSGARADIIPFGFALGQVATLIGLNNVGLRRRGATRVELHGLRRAYQALFFGDGVFADRLQKVEAEYAQLPAIKKIIEFIRMPRKRPLMHPGNGGASDDRDGG
jgi:UDP-N-acetylglucosamine acyltransferase